MKKLAIKSILFLSLITIGIALVYILLPESKENVMASIIDKEALLESTNSPKIVLVGGSNVAFGIDSEMIDDNFNYEVVNTSLTGGMGLTYMLSFVKPYLREGDIVILALEYQILYNNKYISYIALNEALGLYPAALKYVSPFGDPIQPTRILRTIQRRTLNYLGLSRKSTINHLSRTGFNKYGDLIEHLDKGPMDIQVKRYPLKYKPANPEIINELNDFYKYCLERGVKVYLTSPPFPQILKPDLEINGDQWTSNLQQSLLIPIISDPDDYLFPENYFWGQAYHLNADGRRERTQILVKDLKIALEKNRN